MDDFTKILINSLFFGVFIFFVAFGARIYTEVKFEKKIEEITKEFKEREHRQTESLKAACNRIIELELKAEGKNATWNQLYMSCQNKFVF